MKNVILINTPLENMSDKEDSIPPLGLGYIAYQLEKKKFNVELLDAFNQGFSKKEIIKKINEIPPYAITLNIFTSNINIVKDIVENLVCNVKIFIGGLVVKDIYSEILKWNSDKDINIIIGEGEYIIPAILEGKDEIKPIEYKKNIKVFKVEKTSKYFPNDINKLFIKRDLFKNEPQINKYNQEEAYIITSRGCPYCCTFCGAANSSYNKKTNLFKVRSCSKEIIINEIEEIKKIHLNVKSIRILDDLFLLNKSKAEEAIEIFKLTNLQWRSMAHSKSFDSFTEETYKDLKESGCKELFIGIESGSEEILKKIKKERSNLDLLKHIDNLLKNGINVKGYFIYGFPNENRKQMEETYSLFKKIKEIEKKYNYGVFEASVFGYRPYHGTELYEKLFKETKKDLQHEQIKVMKKKKMNFNLNLKNYSDVSNEELERFISKTK